MVKFLRKPHQMLLYCLFCTIVAPGYSQQLASVGEGLLHEPVNQKQKNGKLLINVLKEISEEFDVNFYYDEESVKEKLVRSEIKGGNIDTVLDQVLIPLGLTSVKLNNSSFKIEKIESKKFKKLENLKPTMDEKHNSSLRFPQKKGLKVIAFTVKGQVTSMGSNDPLPGVNVIVKDTGMGTVTDIDGMYSINVPDENSVLVFSSVGYISEEVVVGDQSILDISLNEDLTTLGEIVITGYGTQEKREVSGSIASIDGSTVENIPAPSLDKVIQGRAAGVQVNSNNGIPGGATEVRIRGVGSVNAGNQPLYIVDGVQITPENRNRSIASSNPLNGINANDIESVDILKDAAAASIYGAQAGNGVIIITTKQGKAGKPRVSFNSYLGFTDLIKKPGLLTGPEYVALRREAAINSGELTGPYDIDATYGNAEDAPTYDWIDAVTRKGALQNYELSVSGGNDKIRYYVAGSYNDQKYHFEGYDFNRGTFRVNLDSKLSEKVSLETKVNLSRVKQNSSDAPSFQLYNPFITGLSISPIHPFYNEDGSYNLNLDGWGNPLSFTEQNKNQGITNQVIGNFAANYDITPHLRFRSSYSLEYTDLNEELFYDPRNPAGVGTNGLVRFGNSQVMNWQTDQTLTYSREFADAHQVDALVGFNYRNEEFTTTSTEGTGVATPEFGETLTGTSPNVISSTYSAYKLVGLFARLGYTYQDKYIVQGTIRRDGSSRFGDNNKFGYFPAVSAAWRMGDEAFMEGQNVVSDLKLRASYGETGNSQFLTANVWGGRSVIPSIEANFPALSLFTSNQNASYNGNAGITFFQLGNADLGWERNITKNFGVDYGLFDNRISGSVDYFIRTTKDMLLSRPLPTTSGFANIAQNVGSLENRGWEIAVSTINLTGDFKWTTDFNITFLHNEVLSLIEDGQDLPDNNLWVGQPVGMQYFVEWAGVNPADGRPMWYDQNGNITYNPVADDRHFVGSTQIPDYYGGITNTFSFKGFELTAFFQYQVGTIQHDQPTAWLLSDFRYTYNQTDNMLNRWNEPGQITSVPKLYPGAIQPGTASSIFGANYPYGATDKFHENASYIRLKTLTLGYTLPSDFLSRIKLSRARVYLQGYNLWTATNYTGLDPEFTSGGYNMGLAPQGKSYMVGLQIGF